MIIKNKSKLDIFKSNDNKIWHENFWDIVKEKLGGYLWLKGLCYKTERVKRNELMIDLKILGKK